MPLRIETAKQGIVWNGSFFVTHSLALVNRELSLALLDRPEFKSRFELGIQHYETPTFDTGSSTRFPALNDAMRKFIKSPAVTISHKWPPNFTAPPTGRLVEILPWEFGSAPKQWCSSIKDTVDEVWVPSSYVRDCYIESGVPGEKIVVVPNGVDISRLNPDVVPYDFDSNPKTAHLRPETYKYLFVGGTISRKGIDILLDAYDKSFTVKDDVCLIIKDFGTSSFYANQGMSTLIEALQRKPGGARIVYLTQDMSDAEIAGLYKACDCLVHPYRGEGYGLPIAEAMACGKPVIVTGAGAALDFANDSNAFLIDSKRQFLPQTHIGDLETVGTPFMEEPNTDSLIALLKYVRANPEQALEKGSQAALDIAAKHTWANAAETALARIIALSEMSEKVNERKSITLPAGFGNLRINGGPAAPPAPILKSVNTYEDRKQAGIRQAREGAWEAAVSSLEACLVERPKDWDVINALAVALFRNGKTERAVEMLRDGVAIAPSPRDFYHNLAFILVSENRYEEACAYCTKALAITPDQADIRTTMEKARNGVLKQARKILKGFPDKDRSAAKKDPEYIRLMELYHSAQSSLILPVSSPPVPAHKKSDKLKISLCMIVKNEERFLRNCLKSVQGAVDEIVIVDTGSTDTTLDIAREFGAKIVQHTWNEDFSEARNVSLKHATGNWAIWLDADEELAPGSVEILKKALKSCPSDTGAFMIKFNNWLTSPTRKPGSEMAVHHGCRVFRRLPGVHFQGRIHEQNLQSLMALGYKYVPLAGVEIDHFGYAGEIMTLRNKHQRFISMLKREVEECPLSQFRTFQLFNLGNAYFTFGDMENAAVYLAKAAENPDIAEEYTVTNLVELATAYHRLSRSKEGLEICLKADQLGIQQAGIEFARGYCLLHLLRYKESEAAFLKALRFGKESSGLYANTGDAGAGSYKARYGLGLALVGQERYSDAATACELAITEQPGLVDARYLLSVCWIKMKKFSEARQTLETVLLQKPTMIEARRDIGAMLLNMKDYNAALRHLQIAAESDPSNYDVLTQLATCCEHVGLIDAAKEVYSRLRKLRPESAEICVNLGRVLALLGSDAEAIDCFSDAITVNPKYGNAYFNAGDLLYKLGFYNRAAETFLSGLEVEPTYAPGFFMLGNCYVQTQVYSAAILSYQQALAENPDYTEAKNNLELAEELAAKSEPLA